MSETTQNNRTMFQENFPTAFGTYLTATVYPVDGTYTIKDHEGRDIREQEMPLTYMKHLRVARENIEIWAEQKMQEYNGELPPPITTTTTDGTDTTSDTTDTTGGAIIP